VALKPCLKWTWFAWGPKPKRVGVHGLCVLKEWVLNECVFIEWVLNECIFIEWVLNECVFIEWVLNECVFIEWVLNECVFIEWVLNECVFIECVWCEMCRTWHRMCSCRMCMVSECDEFVFGVQRSRLKVPPSYRLCSTQNVFCCRMWKNVFL